MTSTCCSRVESQVIWARAEMTRKARIASRRDHPRYVEAANQAKAEYIRHRDEQLAHVAACARVDA